MFVIEHWFNLQAYNKIKIHYKTFKIELNQILVKSEV